MKTTMVTKCSRELEFSNKKFDHSIFKRKLLSQFLKFNFSYEEILKFSYHTTNFHINSDKTVRRVSTPRKTPPRDLNYPPVHITGVKMWKKSIVFVWTKWKLFSIGGKLSRNFSPENRPAVSGAVVRRFPFLHCF